MLTKHQQDILNQSLKILENNNRLLIKGAAGVGKTYMVNELIESLVNSSGLFAKSNIVCSAPTNKAVGVLMGKVTTEINVNFSTTHSALKLKRKINNKTGEVTFEPEYREDDPPLRNVRFLFIDETSMLNKNLLSMLEEICENKSIKIIFIGDPQQLPPVNEEFSPVFQKGYPEVELTEIIRQGEGNPIIDLSRNIASLNFSKEDNLNSEKQGYVYTQNINKIVNTLALANGTDEVKYLSWTNKDVDIVNKKVREKIYDNPDKIELGETLMFNAPYGDKYFNNEEIKVKELEVAIVKIYHNFAGKGFGAVQEGPVEVELKVYCINPKDFRLHDNFPRGVIVVHEDSEYAYNELIRDFTLQCKIRTLRWTEYYQFIEQFGDLKYNHALTVHKSQGSTYQKAIINVNNINLNRNLPERKRMLYTGITRASKLLILADVKNY